MFSAAFGIGMAIITSKDQKCRFTVIVSVDRQPFCLTVPRMNSIMHILTPPNCLQPLYSTPSDTPRYLCNIATRERYHCQP